MTVRKKHVLKIAQVAPIIERVPPKKYGGTERMVYALSEELVYRGHDVTLFASGDSVTSARLASVYPRSLREVKMDDLYGVNTWTLLNIGSAYSRAQDFDVIHDHNGHISIATANMARRPVIMTMHGPVTSHNRRIFEMLRGPKLVSISKAQGKTMISMNHLDTVYNGLSMEHYPFSYRHDGYLLFVGRLSLEKGPHHAIEVAQYLDLPLIIAAKLDAVDMRYFREYIGPKLSDDRIKWIGEVDEEARNRLMSRALCLLHPVTWNEPFGLTMVEAMACGAPVIGFNRGSIPELVRHGKTGFVVEDVEDMIDAVANLSSIKRIDCRNHALEHFNGQKMADHYERLYYKVLGIKQAA